MKTSNINSHIVRWSFIFILALWGVHLVWTQRMTSLFWIAPLLITVSAYRVARGWEQRQKRRLLARYQSSKMLLWFFFLMAGIGVIATFYFPSKNIDFAPVMFLSVMLIAAGDFKRYGRWVKKKPALISA